MTFNEYQKESKKTVIYSEKKIAHPLSYLTLGLVGEAGEAAEKVKKLMRDHDDVVDEDRKEGLIQEMGDVLWYMAQIATELGVDLEAVPEANLKKIFSRKQRGVIQGEGDKR